MKTRNVRTGDLPLPTDSRSKPHDTNRLLAYVFGGLGLALAVLGLSDLFPAVLNILAYVAGLGCICFGILRWEAARHWGHIKRILIFIVVCLTYLGIFGYAGWKQYQKEYAIPLEFKDSPLFTWWIRQRTVHDIANFRAYLQGLGLETSSVVPPFAVQTGKNAGQCGAATPPGLPVYRGEITIGESAVSNRQTVLLCYAQYEIADRHPLPSAYLIDDFMLFNALSQYFVESYSGKQREPQAAEVFFWGIRKAVGRDLSDRLAARTLEVALDSPMDSPDNRDVWLYFISRIKIAESSVDNECSHWPQIERVFVGSGVALQKIREQDMSHSQVPTACLQVWAK